MKRVIYITGCLGFIGSYITQLCLDLGWYVKGVDKMTYAANDEVLMEFQKCPNFSFVKCDINNLEFLYDCDYIINTAAETHVGNSIVNSKDFVHSNVDGVHNILELMRNYRQESGLTPTLIHFSTDEVYGDVIEGAHKETDILRPSNPYSATKAAADMLILAWGRTYNLPYVIVRPTNNYGERQYVEKLIPKTCKYIGLGRKIPLHNQGTPIRNWLHASDTANAIIKIIESGKTNEIYNISGGYEQTNLEIVEKILILLEKPIEHLEDYVDFSITRPGQDVRYCLDDSKLKSLGWGPQAVFDEELVNIVKYYKNKFIW